MDAIDSSPVITNLAIFLLVTFIFLLFCSNDMKLGMTDPLDPITLPNLIADILIFLFFINLSELITNFSANNFDFPITLVGETTLSVLINTNFETLLFIEALTIFLVPCRFVCMASDGLYSEMLTCLIAAACTTISTSLVISWHLLISLTSPKKILFFVFSFG